MVVEEREGGERVKGDSVTLILDLGLTLTLTRTLSMGLTRIRRSVLGRVAGRDHRRCRLGHRGLPIRHSPS